MSIADNIQSVQENIAAACAKVNRDPETVTLIGVSKTKPVAMLVEAIHAGVQHLGENRVEEGETKIPTVNAQVETAPTWHMIGHIQSRKAKLVPPLFQVVHSVDTLKLAQKLSKLLEETDDTRDVFLEINISGEDSKYGFNAANWSTDLAVREQLWSDVQTIFGLPGLRVRGLMTMAPIVDDMEQTRPIFADMAALRAELSNEIDIDLPDLSMGMTDDYPVAVEEGATLVRVGRAIFGERVYT